ncbi:MAG: hypothetical protein IKY98_01105, partial [Alphaproteobacteria bacterium]|nr:hypothetical protein [Alphaproteobacteria bacterium]
LLYPTMDAAIATRQTFEQIAEESEKENTNTDTPTETKRKTQERFWKLHNERDASVRYTSDANDVLCDELKYSVLEDLGFPALNPDTMSDAELHQYVIDTHAVLTKSEKESFHQLFLEKTLNVIDILPPKALVLLHQELTEQKNLPFDTAPYLTALEKAMDKQIDDYVNGQTVVNQDNIIDVYSGFSSSIDWRLSKNANASKAKKLLEKEINLYDSTHGLNGLSDTNEAQVSHRLDEVRNLIDTVFETPDYIRHLYFVDNEGKTVEQTDSNCEVETLKTIVKDKLLTDITFDFGPLDRSQIKLKADNLFDTAVVSLIANTLYMRGQNPDEAEKVFQKLNQGQPFDIPQLMLAGASAAYVNEQSGLVNRIAQKVGKSSSTVHKMSESIKTVDTMADNRFKEEYPKTNLAKSCLKKFFYGSITGALASGIGLAATAMSLPAAPVIAGAMAVYTLGSMWWQRKSEINQAIKNNQPVPTFGSFLKRNTVRTLLTATSLGSTALGMPVVGLSLGAIGAVKNIGSLYARNRKEGRGIFASFFRAIPEAMATITGAVLTGTAVHTYGADMMATPSVNEPMGQHSSDTPIVSNDTTEGVLTPSNAETMNNILNPTNQTMDTMEVSNTVSDISTTDTGSNISSDTGTVTASDTGASDTATGTSSDTGTVTASDTGADDTTGETASDVVPPNELSEENSIIPKVNEGEEITNNDAQAPQSKELTEYPEDAVKTEFKTDDQQPHSQHAEEQNEESADKNKFSESSVKMKDVQEILDRADVPDDIGEDTPADSDNRGAENEPRIVKTVHHNYTDEAHQLAQDRLAGKGLFDKTGTHPILPDYTTDELNRALSQITKLEETHPEFTGSNGVSNADILMHKLNQVDRLISEDTTLKIDGHRIDAEQALGVKTPNGWYSAHDLRADLLSGNQIDAEVAAEVLGKVEMAVDEFGRFTLDVHGLDERRFVSFELNSTPGFTTQTVETVITDKITSTSEAVNVTMPAPVAGPEHVTPSDSVTMTTSDSIAAQPSVASPVSMSVTMAETPQTTGTITGPASASESTPVPDAVSVTMIEPMITVEPTITPAPVSPTEVTPTDIPVEPVQTTPTEAEQPSVVETDPTITPKTGTGINTETGIGTNTEQVPVSETVIAPQSLAEPIPVIETTVEATPIPTAESTLTREPAAEQTTGQKIAQMLEISPEVNETIKDIVSTVQDNPTVQKTLEAISPVLDNPTVQQGINTVKDIFQSDNPPPVIVPFENKQVIQSQSQRQEGLGAAPMPKEGTVVVDEEPAQKNKGHVVRHPATSNASRPPKMGVVTATTQGALSNATTDSSKDTQTNQKPNTNFFRNLFVRGKDPK